MCIRDRLGVGITLITYIRQISGAMDSGIDIYLFGETASLTSEEFIFLRVSSLVIVLVMLLYFTRIKIVIFNTDLAKTTHFHTMFYIHLINIMVIWLVAFAVKLMGVFLAVTVFLMPAVTARLWSNRLIYIFLLAGFFGGLSGAIGSIISSNLGTVTLGVAMTLTLGVIFILSLLIAPKGIIAKRISRRRL